MRIDGDLLAFAAPPRIRSGPVAADTLAAVTAILGIEREAVVDAEWLDNGPGWVGLLLDSAHAVLELRPDASSHPGRWDIGVIGPHRAEAETRFELRAFSTEGTQPLREDPVTGSLNAAAAQWLLASGRASVPYVAAQGTAIGRRGRIHVTTEDGQVWVGGRTDIVLSGTAAL